MTMTRMGQVELDTIFGPEMLDVWRLLGGLLGTLVLLAGTLWAGKHVAEQVRAVWRAVRGYQGAAIGAVDQPGDPVIVQLARVSGVPASVWAAFLPAFLGALAVGLDRVVGDAAANKE